MKKNLTHCTFSLRRVFQLVSTILGNSEVILDSSPLWSNSAKKKISLIDNSVQINLSTFSGKIAWTVQKFYEKVRQKHCFLKRNKIRSFILMF